MNKYISILILLLGLNGQLIAQTDSVGNHYRVFINGGCGILLSSSKNTIEQLNNYGVDKAVQNKYLSALEKGFTSGFEIYRMLNQNLGYGLKYQYFNASSNITTTTEYNPSYYLNDYIYNGDISENIQVNYIGIGLYSNNNSAPKKGFGTNYSLSLGPVFYRDEKQFFTESSLITKTTFGADLSVGIDYHFIKQLSIGVRLSALYASFKDAVINDGTQVGSNQLQNPENLSRVNCVGYLSLDI